MMGDYSTLLACSMLATLCIVTSAAPLVDQQQQQRQGQISNGFGPYSEADFNRFFMKTKKWSPSASGAAGSQFSGFMEEPEAKWNHVRNFYPEKRMDDNDYPTLNSGRLEWNFNRL